MVRRNGFGCQDCRNRKELTEYLRNLAIWMARTEGQDLTYYEDRFRRLPENGLRYQSERFRNIVDAYNDSID